MKLPGKFSINVRIAHKTVLECVICSSCPSLSTGTPDLRSDTLTVNLHRKTYSEFTELAEVLLIGDSSAKDSQN